MLQRPMLKGHCNCAYTVVNHYYSEIKPPCLMAVIRASMATDPKLTRENILVDVVFAKSFRNLRHAVVCDWS